MGDTIKTLHIVVAPPHLHVSGANNAAYRLATAMARTAPTQFASMAGVSSEPTANCRIIECKPRLRLPRWLPRALRSMLASSDIDGSITSESADVVHLHNVLPAIELLRLTRICRRRGVATAVTLHGIYEVLNPRDSYQLNALQRILWRPLVMWPLKRAIETVSLVHVFSEADVALLRRNQIKVKRLTVAPNAIDRSTEGVELRSGDQRRGGDRPTLFFLGNHTRNKGVDVLLEALQYLQHPCTVIIGGEARPEIEYSAPRPHGVDLVVTGRLSDEAAADAFAGADVFVFPTRADTYPLVVLEAMNAGCAIVASNISGIPEQVSTDCAVLVEPGDPWALAVAINSVLSDRNRLAAMKEAAIRRAEGLPSWDEIAERLLLEYEEVLSAVEPH